MQLCQVDNWWILLAKSFHIVRVRDKVGKTYLSYSAHIDLILRNMLEVQELGLPTAHKTDLCSDSSRENSEK